MGLEGVVKGGAGAEVKSLENEVEFSPIKGTCIFSDATRSAFLTFCCVYHKQVRFVF